MFEIKFDLTEFEKAAERFQRAATDQVPFALSVALNRAVETAQASLIQDTWPRSVKVRNPTFLRAALRREYSTKTDLRVAVVDVLGRGSLKMHAEGGVKTPKGQNLAIPTSLITRGAHGVPASQRPRALIARTAKKALRITAKGIFVARKGQGLRMVFALTPKARIRKDVPFHEDFEHIMRESVRASFPIALAKALSTRR